MIKRIFTLLLALALTLGTFSYLAAYANDTDSSASLPVISTLGDLPEWNEPTVTDSGYLLSYRGDTPLHSTALTDAYLRGEKKGGTRDILPARYDGRDYGYLPAELRNQGGFGSCWAHGALASVETYMIKHGVTDGATGQPAATDIDLSEYALVSFTYNKAYDKLCMTEGDETYPIGDGDPDNFCVKLDTGGYAELAGYTLMRWEGAAPESVSALSYGSITPYGPAPSYAWQYDSVHVQGFTTVPTENAEQVKRMLMEYGAGEIAFYYDNEYYNADTSSYYDPDHTATNHAVTLVGWDDDYP